MNTNIAPTPESQESSEIRLRAERIQWDDEKSFYAARRKWESWVMSDEGLTTTDKVVGWGISSFAKWHTHPYCSAETLAQRLNLKPRTVEMSLSNLRKRGWIFSLHHKWFNGPMIRALTFVSEYVDEIERRWEEEREAKQTNKTQCA